MGDNVNHPAHYETGRFECIDVMLETQGTEAVKSFVSAMHSNISTVTNERMGFEDIRKAIWYLNKAVELEDKDHEKTETKCSKTQYVAGGIYPAEQKGGVEEALFQSCGESTFKEG